MPGPITDAQRDTLRIMEDLLLIPVVVCDDERVADGLHVSYGFGSYEHAAADLRRAALLLASMTDNQETQGCASDLNAIIRDISYTCCITPTGVVTYAEETQ